MKRNNELCEEIDAILNSDNITDEQKKAIGELKNEYEWATYKEYSDRHEYYRKMVSKMVNDMSFEDEELAKYMACEHPTLQQSFMRFVALYIKEMANKQHCDGRNQNSVHLAKELLPIVEKEGYLPFV